MSRKNFFLYFGLFLGIEAVLFGLLFWGKERAERQYIESVLAHHQGEYDSNLAGFGRLARFSAQETSGFLGETGGVGTVQEIDLAV